MLGPASQFNETETGADWPVGLSGDRPVGPSEIFKFFLSLAIKERLVLFSGGPPDWKFALPGG